MIRDTHKLNIEFSSPEAMMEFVTPAIAAWHKRTGEDVELFFREARDRHTPAREWVLKRRGESGEWSSILTGTVRK